MTVAEKNRDFQILLDDLKKQNWAVEQTSRNHFQFKSPDGKGLVTAGGSYGDYRAIKNLISQLRRAGFTPTKGMGRK